MEGGVHVRCPLQALGRGSMAALGALSPATQLHPLPIPQSCQRAMPLLLAPSSPQPQGRQPDVAKEAQGVQRPSLQKVRSRPLRPVLREWP